MSNLIKSFTELSDAEKKARGLYHTPREILQQPRMWVETRKLMAAMANEIKAILTEADKDHQIILTGAGTSEFVGRSLENLFNKHPGCQAKSVATTSIITYPEAFFKVG